MASERKSSKYSLFAFLFHRNIHISNKSTLIDYQRLELRKECHGCGKYGYFIVRLSRLVFASLCVHTACLKSFSGLTPPSVHKWRNHARFGIWFKGRSVKWARQDRLTNLKVCGLLPPAAFLPRFKIYFMETKSSKRCRRSRSAILQQGVTKRL